MTMSCICIAFDKQMLLRTKRFMRVRKVRCLRSICCVLRLPGLGTSGSRWGVRAPMIGGVAGQPEGLEQCFALHKDFVFAATKDVCEDLACVVIDGMPQPAWVAFVPDKRPHLIDLRFPSVLYVPGHLSWVQRVQQSGVHRLQHGFFLLEFTQHG